MSWQILTHTHINVKYNMSLLELDEIIKRGIDLFVHTDTTSMSLAQAKKLIDIWGGCYIILTYHD